MKANLGDLARDTVSGLTGIVTSRTEYLNGCIRVGLQPRIRDSESDKLPDSAWIDEEQLVILEADAYSKNTIREFQAASSETVENERLRAVGGDRPAPQRAPDPTR